LDYEQKESFCRELPKSGDFGRIDDPELRKSFPKRIRPSPNWTAMFLQHRAGACPRLLTRRKGPNDSTFSRAGSLENKVADEIGFFFELFQKFGSIDVVVSQKHIVGREWRVE
jgi:hypothetical protein